MPHSEAASSQREQWLLPLLNATFLTALELLRLYGHRVPGGGAAATLLIAYTAYRAGVLPALFSALLLSFFIVRSAEAGFSIPTFGVVSAIIGVAVLIGWLSARQRAALVEALVVREKAQLNEARYRELAEHLDRVLESERAALDTAQESERKLRAFINNAPDALIVNDTTGAIVEVNGRACQMLGYTRSELLEMNIADLDMPQPATVPCVAEELLRRKDGTSVPVETSVSLWEGAQPQLLITLARDITRKRQLELRLRQAHRMEALGRLAGGIAHDFNNLLTAIRGHADLLRAELNGNAATGLEEISEAAERAAGLTRQLLAFSRQQMLQMQVLELNAVVEEMEKLLVRLIGENIMLITTLDRGVPPIEADRTQLEQVVMNLVLNARDAMPQGGKLRIRTANAVLTEVDADRFAYVKPGNYVLLVVSDEGIGMDAATVAHIFDPFFTTKEYGKGNGLGLATAYGIIKQLGGYIWCDSKVGEGTTFRVYLPRATDGAAVDRRTARTPRIAVARASETILVVEDEPAVRSLVRRVLLKQGYRVLDAANGVQALSLVETYDDPIHLLLTDVVMPEMGGRDLVERLGPLRPDMKVLYMSGYAEDAIVVNHVLQPGFGFLPKPFAPDTLTAKVREALES